MPLARIPTPLPPLYTDSDWAFDFEFFGADETSPAAFAADDAASLVFVRRRKNPAVGFELTTAAGTLVFPATHIVGARVDAAFLAGREAGLYDFELRRLGADGAIEALVVGEVAVVAGLKPQLDGLVPAGGGLAGGTSGAGAKIFTDAGAIRIVRGTGGATGLPGPTGPSGQPIGVGAAITGDTVLALADANLYRRATNAAPATVTVPAAAAVAFPVGTQISFRQTSAALTLAGAAGVTLNPPFGGTLVLAGAGATASLIKVAADEWDLVGQTEAAP